MRIFVTVGTTPFEELHEAAIRQLPESYEVVFQTWKTNLRILRGIAREAFDDVYVEYMKADLIITHGGAGTVFPLLEMGKKIVVVPNLKRRDQHQKELAKFVEVNSFGCVVWEIQDLGKMVEIARLKEYMPYVKYDFFMAQEITSRIKTSMSRSNSPDESGL